MVGKFNDELSMRQYTDQQKFAEVYRHEYGHRIDDNFLRYLPENKRKQIAIITKGNPIALLVASKSIKIPVAPIISSTGTLNPNISLTKRIPPLFTRSS